MGQRAGSIIANGLNDQGTLQFKKLKINASKLMQSKLLTV